MSRTEVVRAEGSIVETWLNRLAKGLLVLSGLANLAIEGALTFWGSWGVAGEGVRRFANRTGILPARK